MAVRSPTATFDRLAKNGLRYTQFHTTGLCSPTRAALLSGRNHHSAASGVIMELGTGFPGYNTLMPKSCGTFAEVLKQNGYNTAWYGKNHNVQDWHSSQAGPFDLWPTGLGFEYFYGFIGANRGHFGRPAARSRPLAHAQEKAVTPEEARSIAREATIYGFPLVDNYRVLYSFFVDKASKEYKGAWNQIDNEANVFTSNDRSIQTPNSDTPYSHIGTDVRAASPAKSRR